MKKIILMSIVSLTIMVSMNPSLATIKSAVTDDVTSHSGGCRKSSPAGECCHAGSEPLHCH